MRILALAGPRSTLNGRQLFLINIPATWSVPCSGAEEGSQLYMNGPELFSNSRVPVVA